jgi:hypothetical protein
VNPSHKIEDPAAAKRSSMRHLKLLLEVLDNDLQHIFDIRREIKAGLLTRIAFEDLWHLFEFGQVVKSSENENQLYRVVRWTGGRSDFLPRPPAISNVRKENRSLAFFVDCVYSDYDGRSYYPIQETLAIYKYDGEKEITSLPVFPFLFDPDFQNMSARLVARGKKWLKLGYADVATHKQYTGLSLDSPQAEEVRLSPASMHLLHVNLVNRLILRSSSTRRRRYSTTTEYRLQRDYLISPHTRFV